MKLLFISIICIVYLYEVNSEVHSLVTSEVDSQDYVDEVWNESTELHSEAKENKSLLQPQFDIPISNVSVAVGDDVTLSCKIRQLGAYRVAWINGDTRAILSIHTYTLTNDRRVTVDHRSLSNTLDVINLNIKSVTEEDRGGYRCQINTEEMISQVGYLDVMVPPSLSPPL